MHEYMGQPRGQLQLLAPPLESIGASKAIRSHPNGLPSGSWVKCSAQPAIIRAIVMGGWSGSGYLRWFYFVPSRDGVAKLVQQITGIGWVRALESGNSGERMWIDGLVLPLPEHSRHNRESYRCQRSVRRKLALKPLDVVRLSGEQIHTLRREQNKFVPSREVDV